MSKRSQITFYLYTDISIECNFTNATFYL